MSVASLTLGRQCLLKEGGIVGIVILENDDRTAAAINCVLWCDMLQICLWT